MRAILIAAALVAGHAVQAQPIADTPFAQPYREAYPLSVPEANDVRAIAVVGDDSLLAATGAGVYMLNDGEWSAVPGLDGGPAYDVTVTDAKTAYAGTWEGAYRIDLAAQSAVRLTSQPVSAVAMTALGLVALGPDGGHIIPESAGTTDAALPWKYATSRNVRAIEAVGDDVYVATGLGLFRIADGKMRAYRDAAEMHSIEFNDIALAPDGRLWAATWGGIDLFEHGARIDRIGTEDGLPYFDVTAIAFDSDGTVWAGTPIGLARYDGGPHWNLYRGKRWLLADEVRDVAVGPDGTVWAATAAGVSAMRFREMTLHDKAAYYQDILDERHVRPPGLVEKIHFPDPENPEVYRPLDDDNDGEYTNLYLAMESFRYAVTGSAEAKANADRAFDAMVFLREVTGTEGFIARTVVPAGWPEVNDPNRTYTAIESIERRVRDPRYKPVEVRWRESADGQWLWKGDTSSDEMTGHFYGSYVYYKHAADDARKEKVRTHVRALMSHIVDGGYVLRDTDGEATRWGVWSPEKLLGDPDWHTEAPINAIEILSYLKTSAHITGDPRFHREYRRLIDQHGYAELARRPKRYTWSERTHIDDSLLIETAVPLIELETDPRLRALYLEGIAWAFQTTKDDMNPLADFTYAMLGVAGVDFDQAVFFLRDQPLDLRQFAIDNSVREDVKLVRRPMLDSLQLDRMLPPSERGVMRWDKNPWDAVSGDFGDPEGHRESSGVFWLLPYWLGRYNGYIAAPSK